MTSRLTQQPTLARCIASAWMMILALAIGITTTGTMRAQDGKGIHDICKDSCCQTDVLVLNTGYDNVAGAVLPVGSVDPYWHVIGDVGGGPVPRAANVNAPQPPWTGPQPNSQWIGGVSGAPDKNLGKMIYEKCFCVCAQKTVVTFNLSILSDDSASVFIDHVFVGNTPQMSFLSPTTMSITLGLGPGVHCIEVEVDNIFPVLAGFDLVGTVQGSGLVKYNCCNDAIIKDPDDCTTTDATIVTDGTWTITSGPAYAGGFPRCADVVTQPNVGWAPPINGTNWIGPNNSGKSSGGDFTYHKCFCMEQNGTVTIKISVMADDQADIYFDGAFIATTPNPAFHSPTMYTIIAALDAGCHCFDFVVHDLHNVVSGMDALIQIHGQNIAKPGCCRCDDCNNGGVDGNPQGRTVPRTGGSDGAAGVNGVKTKLGQSMLMAIPNPTGGATTLNYVLGTTGAMTLDLYNTAGQHIRSLDGGPREAGTHTMSLDTKDLERGTYYVVMTMDGHTFTLPLTVQ